MADKNIVMDRADMLIAVHGISQSEIDNPAEDGCVAEREVEGVGTVKYYLSLRKTASIPDQFGDHS